MSTVLTPQVLLDDKTAVMTRETRDKLDVGIPCGPLQVGTFWKSRGANDGDWNLWEVLPGVGEDRVELKSRRIEVVE